MSKLKDKYSIVSGKQSSLIGEDKCSTNLIKPLTESWQRFTRWGELLTSYYILLRVKSMMFIMCDVIILLSSIREYTNIRRSPYVPVKSGISNTNPSLYLAFNEIPNSASDQMVYGEIA